MKILIVMGGFFPGKEYGGPPVSVDNFCSLMKEHSCYIVTRNHDLLSTTPYSNINKGWNDRGNCKVLYLSERNYNKGAFERIIIKIKPDVIYLQSIFQRCVLPCLQIAKKYNLKVLLAPRGELCAGALNIKKYKKLSYIKLLCFMNLTNNVYYQSTSEEETAAINELLNCPINRIYRLDNIPSIPTKKHQRNEKVAGKGRFIFLARIHPKKNLLSAIKYFNHVESEVVFDIYGSIEDEAYWQECQTVIKGLPKNIKCTYKGNVPHDQVHEVFSRYDAFVFPTLSENYGHVIVESLIVGTPVIVSKGTTPWDEIEAHGGFSILLSDSDKWSSTIEKISSMDGKEFKKLTLHIMSFINEKLSISRIGQQYNDMLSSVTSNN